MFGVLGPVVAWDDAGDAIDLRGPRHRAVLARLIIARGRVVPVGVLVDDLWTAPPPGAVSAVRTFVAALRRALEPERPPRARPRVLVTEGPGYALHADDVDAWRFEHAVGEGSAERLEEALGWWRGPAYADFADEPWARAERSRLDELRLHAVERLAEARLAGGAPAEAVPDLEAHVAVHPLREDAWRLLALALYRSGRQGDALAVLRRARGLLVDRLGVEPGPSLRKLEADILRHADHLTEPDAAARVWARAATAYDRTVASGSRDRLESTVGLLRTLALAGGGGLAAAREQRMAAISASEDLGDPELTARVIGSYDVPAIWTRSDDPRQAGQVVAAAERALAALPPGRDATRARLLATVALESRGTRSARGPEAAGEAEAIARRLDDPALLAFALNAVFMQSFERTGLAPRRDGIGAELVALSERHGLTAFEILGHLIRLQACSGMADLPAADRHASAAEGLADRHERPLVRVFTGWYRALRTAAAGRPAEAAYREAAALLDGCGMPGLERGLVPLALLSLRVLDDRPAPTEPLDWGPYEPWARPLVLLAQARPGDAADALRRVPDPPRDLMQEALWCLAARAAVALDDRGLMRRAREALAPAAAELAGAASGLVTLGPVSDHLAALTGALRRSQRP
ncbi:AfsR/SARP family transcriptional regulator [Actinomadura litoris]|uniref:SARP family transcriptional regulator n=1 Tax=Actinomadura litoris TaxID=2678616 RepID=A0A7K1LD39_9ACTN|nr:AfsR/SARP family transcriptional regulator [Actinomadura litoris]MUN42095.1 SARP family transcriptional regulator [Actinomadura litoris]